MTDTVATQPGERSGEPPAERGVGSTLWKLRALEAVLDRAGVAYHAVRSAGGEDEIAVVEAPQTELSALSGLARDVRHLGFRFLALDLATGGAQGAGWGRAGSRSSPVDGE